MQLLSVSSLDLGNQVSKTGLTSWKQDIIVPTRTSYKIKSAIGIPRPGVSRNYKQLTSNQDT